MGFLAVGCGGSVTISPGNAGGSGGTSGRGDAGGNAAITGSYDLKLANIVPSNPVAMDSPSEGATVRIDIRKLPSGYFAAATPRWGDPTPLSIGVSEKSVTLTGSVRIGSDGFVSDEWTKLVVARDAQGRLAGPISATGEETFSTGDMIVEPLDITGGGKIGPDMTPPELRSSPGSSDGPGNRLLPWDPIVLHVAEGVDQSQLRSHVSIDPAVTAGSGGASGGPPGVPANLSVTWQLSPSANDKLGWVGATNATARIGNWSMDVGGTFALRVDAGVLDPAGNSASAFNTTFTWLSIGQPRKAFDFISPGVGSWGKVLFQQPCPPGVCAGPPMCESGSCAVLGPFDNSLCGGPIPLGIAGRLYGGAKLVVRWRVLLGAADASSAPFSVDIATPGHAAEQHSVYVDTAALKPLPSPIGQLRWATDFETLVLPASSASEVGFAVIGGRDSGNCDLNGPTPVLIPTAVIIDSVTTR